MLSTSQRRGRKHLRDYKRGKGWKGWISFFGRCDGFSDRYRHFTSESVKPEDNFLFIETSTLSKSSDAESFWITIKRWVLWVKKMQDGFLFASPKFQLIYLFKSQSAWQNTTSEKCITDSELVYIFFYRKKVRDSVQLKREFNIIYFLYLIVFI